MHTKEELALYNQAVTDVIAYSAEEVAFYKLSSGWGSKSQSMISANAEGICAKLFPQGTVLADYRPAEVYADVCEFLGVDPDLNYSHKGNRNVAGYSPL